MGGGFSHSLLGAWDLFRASDLGFPILIPSAWWQCSNPPVPPSGALRKARLVAGIGAGPCIGPRSLSDFRVSVTLLAPAWLPEKPGPPSCGPRHSGGPFPLTGLFPPRSLPVVPLIPKQRQQVGRCLGIRGTTGRLRGDYRGIGFRQGGAGEGSLGTMIIAIRHGYTPTHHSGEHQVWQASGLRARRAQLQNARTIGSTRAGCNDSTAFSAHPRRRQNALTSLD